MKLKPISTNCTEITTKDGTEILFSYETPVAAINPAKGGLVLVTSRKFSNTTTRHINKWLETKSFTGKDFRSQEYFEELEATIS